MDTDTDAANEFRTDALSPRYNYKQLYESDKQYHTLQFDEERCFFVFCTDANWYVLVRPLQYDLFVAPPHTYANVSVPDRICIKTVGKMHSDLSITVPYKIHRDISRANICVSSKTGQPLTSSQLYHRRLMLLNLIWHYNARNEGIRTFIQSNKLTTTNQTRKRVFTRFNQTR